MKTKHFILILFLGGILRADINYGVPYTIVTEKEVRSFVAIGMDQKTVFDKFGPANMTNTEKDGLEVWQYLVNPKAARIAHSSYYGFEVFFKNKKVTYFAITLGAASN
jgi:hypothetical protein